MSHVQDSGRCGKWEGYVCVFPRVACSVTNDALLQ